MKNEEWKKIKSVFQESLERSAAERDLFLRETCGDDRELREEVEQLLAAFEENEYAFESGAVSELAEFIIDETERIDNKHFGRYKIKNLIGEGGMGKVYLAEDTELERMVALKILTPTFFENQERIYRFIREAKTASSLNHPNIITIYEIGQTHDSHFIAAEYVDGETLRQKQNRQPLSFYEILEISIQVVSAIGAAHQARIIHRDIKPENIMIRRDGIVKVLDFGLAKLLPDEAINIDLSLGNSVRQNTLPGMIMGTAAYMSPEQSRGQTLDPRTDLWSFGVCLYEMLNGDRPFKGETISDTIANVLMSEMPPLSAQIPEELSRIVKKSLEKNCADRYQQAEDFATDLVQLRDSLEENIQTVQITHFSSVVHTNDDKKSKHPLNPTATVFSHSNFYRINLFGGVLLLCLIFVSIGFYIYASQPPVFNPEAVRWFESGSESALNGDFYKAQKSLEKAVSTDNRLIKAYAKLAEVQMELDYEDKAAQSILRLTELMPQSSLSEAETVYLLAVVATVRRDYNSAVANYENIAAEAPEGEKKFAYFDLGRALEKIDADDRAIEAYRETVNRDPQFAAAFLRLGNLYWHGKKENEALAAFDTAAAVYTANSNYDGLGELFYQKGNLYNYSENLPEAEKNLKRSLELARATDNLALQIKCNLDLGRIEYSYGDTTNARKLIDEALNSARINQLENLTLNGVIDLGTLFFMKGDYDQSFDYLNQALQIARLNGGKRAEARTFLSLGSLSLLRVQPVEAVKYIEPALNFYRANDFRQEKSQALLALGYAHDQSGNHQSAIELLEELLNVARQENDQPLEANTESALGLTLIHTEKFTESLEHSEKSFQINQSLEREQLAAYATLNKGQALIYLGRYAEARQILNRTGQAAAKASDKQLDSWVYLLLAKCALFEGKTQEALERGEKALQISGQQIEEIVISSNIVAALANIQHGDLPKANSHCQTAKTTAEKIGSARLSAEVGLLQAEIFLQEKDASKALREALRARMFYSSQQAKYSELRSVIIAAEASLKLAQPSDAEEYARQADNIFQFLERSSNENNFYYFKNRRDILFYRSLIDKILSEQSNNIK